MYTKYCPLETGKILLIIWKMFTKINRVLGQKVNINTFQNVKPNQ